MPAELRKSGIAVLGDIPWATHFCQFYETKDDLLEVLVPYFKTGLENNEFCLWIVCDPITTERASSALKKAVPQFDRYLENKSIEIITCQSWYLTLGKFNGKTTNNAWTEKLQNALERGYDGMRVNGNESWLKLDDWNNFMEYENEINSILTNLQMIVLCTYPIDRTYAGTLLDVAHAHHCVISRRKGHWQILEEPELKKKKADLVRENRELDALVAERTKELEKAVTELKNEIRERKRTEQLLIREKELLETVIASIPGYFVLYDEDYRILLWNKQLLSMFGYKAEEIQNLHAVDNFFSPEYRAEVYRNVQQDFAAGYGSRQLPMRKKDGSTIFVYTISHRLAYKNRDCLVCIGVDMSERKKAEEELAMAYQRLSYHVENTPLAVIEFNKDMLITRWSGQAERIFGWKDSEVINKHFLDPGLHLVYTEDISDVKKLRWKFISGRIDRNLSLDRRNFTKDGRVIYCEWYSSVLKDEQGKLVTVMSLVQDITERKKAEEELALAYQRLSYHVQNTPLAVIEFDKNMFITRWSGQAERMFGWNASEAIGKNVLDPDLHLVYATDIAGVEQLCAQLMSGTVDRNLSLNYRNFTKDEKVINCEWYNSVLKDEQGKVVTVLSLVQDITERKKAEEELRLAYQRLSYHVENTPLAVTECDKDLFIRRWSHQAEKIFGWKASEVIGKSIYDESLHLVYKEDEPKVALISNELLNGRVDRNLSLNRNYTKDGRVIFCEWYNSVLRDENGNVITILALIRDVTERKKAEEKLNQSYEQIRSLSAHLRSIREEERKYIAQEIHDELGQQLTVMKMDVSWLNKKIGDNGSVVKERLQELVTTLDATVDSVRRIAHELRPHLLDLGLAAAIEWHLKEFEKRSGIHTSFDEPDEELELDDSVATGLFRIFTESLTNVARHSEASQVHIDLFIEGGQVVLNIKDNGKGFNQQEIAEKKTLGILGMKERCDMLQGHCEIASEPGKGTALTVSIPLAKKNL